MDMRHLLGILCAFTLVLAGCGGEDGGGSDDGATDRETSAETPAESPTGTGTVEPDRVVFVSESAVGGDVLPTATIIDGDRSIEEFSGQFEDSRMADRIAAEAARIDVPDGDELAAAVVALACDAPTEVSVEWTPAGLQVTSPTVKTGKQCLVPVTTVALVTVPAQ